jgi:hypothetical protein
MAEPKFLRMARLSLCVFLCSAAYLWAPRGTQSQSAQKSAARTFDPLPDWRPTHAPENARYAGDEACAQCHTEGATQRGTSMRQAMEPPADRRLLSQLAQLTFTQGPFSYSITRRDSQSYYTVTDGKDSVSLPILYAFGEGKVAQTYVFERDGKFYEGRVSYYGRINGLDLTMGASPATPMSLEGAIGRPLAPTAVNDCFSCHATAAVSQGRLRLDKMTPGVSCEGCHGPGEKHATAMKTRVDSKARGEATSGLRENHIFNPGRFDTEGLTQFCGACHRTWIQVQMMGARGVETVRFQPYRIFGSKCYDHEDRRISCTACHNPHEELKVEAAYYDAKCMACHSPSRETPPDAPRNQSAADRRAPTCPKAGQDCASCHMPKTELPGAHYKFTDHRIRIARDGEPFPN